MLAAFVVLGEVILVFVNKIVRGLPSAHEGHVSVSGTMVGFTIHEGVILVLGAQRRADQIAGHGAVSLLGKQVAELPLHR
jgi:hypothetical protein